MKHRQDDEEEDADKGQKKKGKDKNKKKGVVMDFNFFRPSQTTGFDNRSLKMVRYSDYKFSKAN